mmetsp:Transcript_82294/g.233071  ORF Transcript_82294/g.233071 Transcript_82294/m.233071 type:complete len:248 (+) Transcript_82294:1874-2617(+)
MSIRESKPRKAMIQPLSSYSAAGSSARAEKGFRKGAITSLSPRWCFMASVASSVIFVRVVATMTGDSNLLISRLMLAGAAASRAPPSSAPQSTAVRSRLGMSGLTAAAQVTARILGGRPSAGCSGPQRLGVILSPTRIISHGCLSMKFASSKKPASARAASTSSEAMTTQNTKGRAFVPRLTGEKSCITASAFAKERLQDRARRSWGVNSVCRYFSCPILSKIQARSCSDIILGCSPASYTGRMYGV